MAMEPMQGKWASSRVDLGYNELFCIPEVTSVSFSSCGSVLGDTLEFHQANRGSLRVWLGLVCMQCRGIGPHLTTRGKAHGFSRIAAGTLGTFSSYGGDGYSKL